MVQLDGVRPLFAKHVNDIDISVDTTIKKLCDSLFIFFVESYGVVTVLVVVTMFSRPVVRTLNLITVPEDSLSLTHEVQPAIPVTVTGPQPQIIDLQAWHLTRHLTTNGRKEVNLPCQPCTDSEWPSSGASPLLLPRETASRLSPRFPDLEMIVSDVHPSSPT